MRAAVEHHMLSVRKHKTVELGNEVLTLATLGVGYDHRHVVTLPRPEVRRYVDTYTDEQRKVLSVRPGITDYASIEYIDENTLLAKSDDPDKTYIEEIIPAKIALNMKWINHQTLGEYLKIIFLTFAKIIR